MGMLDTTIKGDLGSVTRLADWLKTTFVQEVDQAIDQAYKARTNTEADWEGPAGDTFRNRMSTGGKKAEQVTEDGETTFKKAEEWVRVTDKHKKKLAAVRDTARAAGLTVTDKGIVDPGQGPAKPTQPAAGANSDQLAQYGMAISAFHNHAKKVAAYNKAAADVKTIREDLNVAQGLIKNVLEDVATKPFLVAAAFANDTYVKKWSKQKAAALDLKERSIRIRALRDARNNPSNGALRGQPLTPEGRRANGQRGAFKWANRINKGAKVVSKTPMLGIPLAIGTTAFDIWVNDKSPSKAIVSGVLSTGVGAGVGALVGAGVGGAVGNVPGVVVGGVAGGLAGLGAGALSDHYWDKVVSDETEKKWDDGLRKGWNKITPW